MKKFSEVLQLLIMEKIKQNLSVWYKNETGFLFMDKERTEYFEYSILNCLNLSIESLYFLFYLFFIYLFIFTK